MKDEDGNSLVTINSFYTQTPDGKYKGHGTEYDFRKLYDYLITKYETDEEPIGLSVHDDQKPNRLSVPAEGGELDPNGLSVPPREDSKSDMYKDLEEKNYKKGRPGEVIFSDDTWTYYSDGTAILSDGSKRSISSMIHIPPEVMAWLDRQPLPPRKRM